jgi:threonine dehydrogenase-like Zn-dependent dehydrogenase
VQSKTGKSETALCRFCRQKLTTACDKTNASTVHEMLYGEKLGGMFGYSHFVGGYAGGQAEFVRVPFGDQNLLKLPDSVPFEKGRPSVRAPVRNR